MTATDHPDVYEFGRQMQAWGSDLDDSEDMILRPQPNNMFCSSRRSEITGAIILTRRATRLYLSHRVAEQYKRHDGRKLPNQFLKALSEEASIKLL